MKSEYAPQNARFVYGTKASAMNLTVYSQDLISGTSGNFTAPVANLSPSTDYYYRAELDVWDPSQKTYVTVSGTIQSFRTKAESPIPDAPGYLINYEVPAVSLSGTYTDGYENYDTERKWYRYNGADANQAVATHTWTSGGKAMRNYTVMMDRSRKCALWCAFAMHSSAWADNNVGRKGSWGTDPAFLPEWQGSGVSGYSKGHLCASNYRQSTTNQNKQTFYHTNQAPQYQNGFNDGVWNQLEQAVKSHAPSGSDTLYVVVGVLFENDNKIDGVSIPSHFYKCLMKCRFDSAGELKDANGCAYLFTNVSHSGESYSSFITSIDAIEERSGIDFFPFVTQRLEELEKADTAAKAESNKTSIF